MYKKKDFSIKVKGNKGKKIAKVEKVVIITNDMYTFFNHKNYE
jgi:hypothetical protein